ncbi:hypothetical protein HID58_078084 [Brassica napus]|uniref:glucose-6-phosphate 1-epimerase n=1 Tax=Brassica napus TaxID=3708 RepID=A0ABQ7YTA2_BRANA|nr:hypothetical protein HID58_078084 [Brassica napus]
MEPSGVSDEKRPTVDLIKDKNGTDQILLQNPKGASVKVIISLHGGQVLSWKTDKGDELLFTSAKANSKPPHPVRGGIPICFPQFGTRGSLEQHGFARNKMWLVEENPPALPSFDSTNKAYIDLVLKPSDEDTTRIWPHCFEFHLRVSLALDGNLTLISRVRNINSKPFSFSIAYHTYFSISDISEVRVEGLETLDYLDNLFEKERFTEQGDALTFESEVDRVYLNSRDVVAVFDHEKKRTFLIKKEGLPDVVVWNPWDKKAKALTDLGDEEYKHMLCVDGAAIEKPINLKSGEEWTGKLNLSLVLST